MRVVQIMEALDVGDGVSLDVLQLQEMLTELGVENELYSRYWADGVAQYTTPIDQYEPREEDLRICHYTGCGSILDEMRNLPGKTVVRYHNVTPPSFFAGVNPQACESCQQALEKIRESIGWFEGYWADSGFNAEDLIRYGADSRSIDVLPILLDTVRLDATAVDASLEAELDGQEYVLFVGRVAPNKCFEDILSAFDCYCRYYDSDTKLILAGNTAHSEEYTKEIRRQIAAMSEPERVIMTGKISDEKLCTLYRHASAFLCMSEHEGFCIPLLEAQHFDIPVLAYASCAVPHTVGKGGVLLYRKDPVLTADLLESLLHDKDLRGEDIMAQRDNVELYSRRAIRARLAELLKKWGVEL